MPSVEFRPLGSLIMPPIDPQWLAILRDADQYGWKSVWIGPTAAGATYTLKTGRGVLWGIFQGKQGTSPTLNVTDGPNGAPLVAPISGFLACWLPAQLIRFSVGLTVTTGGAPTGGYAVVFA